VIAQANEKVQKANEKVQKANEKVQKANEKVQKAIACGREQMQSFVPFKICWCLIFR